jgi:hypothetical protein
MNKPLGQPESHHRPWRAVAHEVIFEADTYAGKLFDILLIVFILISVFALMLDSIAGVHAEYGPQLRALEWFFTIVPTGIVTAEMVQASTKGVNTQACPSCSAEGHDKDARFCKFCGSRL